MRSTLVTLGGALGLSLGLGGLAVVGSGIVASPAHACGNAVFVELSKKDAIELVKTAEELMASGKYRDARLKIARYVGEEDHEGEIAVKGDKKLEFRLYQLYAMAILHSGDELGAKEYLDKLLTEKPKDTFLQIREAEHLAFNPSTREKARKQLEGFAKKDLLVDATAWATLARLRGKAGDADGQKQAVERCQQMAKEAAFCTQPPVPSGRVRGAMLVWARQSYQSTFSGELSFAAGFKVSVHDPGGATRTLDRASFEKDRQRQLHGINYADVSDEKYTLAEKQPKQGDLWEVKARVTYTPSSRRRVKAGDLPLRDYQMQVLDTGEQTTIQSMDVVTPEKAPVPPSESAKPEPPKPDPPKPEPPKPAAASPPEPSAK